MPAFVIGRPTASQVSVERGLQTPIDGTTFKRILYLSSVPIPSVASLSHSAERKKRWIEFPAAQTDIDYAIIVLLEAQFKWTPQIEAEIKVCTNHINLS